MGKIVETVIARHLMERKVFYWRNHNYETDIVMDAEGGVLPVEVKYKNEIKLSDLRGRLKFLETFNQNYGILITKDLLEEKRIGNKLILCIPAWFFLLMVEEHDRLKKEIEALRQENHEDQRKELRNQGGLQ